MSISGRTAFKEEGIVSAKALRLWCSWGFQKQQGPVWLEQSERGKITKDEVRDDSRDSFM